MTHDEAFVQAIRESPSDDGPRLVYSDWLEENGQGARAEFIRVQCELARLEPTDDRYPELHLRQLHLLSEHERDWLGPWADRLVRWRFHRGMLHEVTIQPEPFVSQGADLFARHPVHTVAFVDHRGASLPPEEVGSVLAAPHLALVRGLELSGCRPDEQMFAMFGGRVSTNAWLMGLARASHATQLESIGLPGGTRSGRDPIGPGPWSAFCSAPHLATLRSLDISDAYSTDGPDQWPALCERLADATFAGGLRRISLSRCTLTDEALDRLTASSGLKSLESVDLTACDCLGEAALGAFLRSRPRGGLKEAGLPYGLGLDRLGQWPGLADLEELRLPGSTRRQGERTIHYPDGRVVRWTSGRHVSADEWIELFRSPHLHPTRLGVFGDDVPNEAVVELLRCDWLSGVESLDLGLHPWLPQRFDGLSGLLDRDMPRLGAGLVARRRSAATAVGGMADAQPVDEVRLHPIPGLRPVAVGQSQADASYRPTRP